MVSLIIAEKPAAALKIAAALSDGKIEKKTYNKRIPYYEIERGKEKIIVACAVGHLFNLGEIEKKGWTYPVFNIEWKPAYELSKDAKFTKPYIDLIKKLAKDSDNFYNGCDLDVEGELIFKNILNKLCSKQDAFRLKFSTLTKEDLVNAFNNAAPHIDLGLAEAGETRHFLDHYYGINLSRALTLAIKKAGMFKILSTGRVQGPALSILADREKAIADFKPVPFWQVELISDKINAMHKADKFWNEAEAKNILKKAKGKKAVVALVHELISSQEPPHPFDLTALQIEAYNKLGISPRDTLAIAQELYTGSYISYPRTSSNQLPEAIGFRKIISLIAKQETYTVLASKLLNIKALKPNNGTKTDSAHPAIFPTGEIPEALGDREKKVYDLIVRRFLAAFAEPSERLTVSVEIDVNGEPFVASGTRTVKEGWRETYKPFVKGEEVELPKLEKGQELKVKDIKFYDKETQPPKRYTPASIIKELEKKNLGTKATRSEILEHLFQRDYIKDSSIRVTELGLKTVTTLKKFCPEVLDDELTRTFEKEMEEVQERKKKEEEILNRARVLLTKIFKNFKDHELEIGQALMESYKATMEKESLVGKCPVCKEGNLRITYSRISKKQFVACDKYPNCKTTFSIPYGWPKPTGEVCKECGFPTLLVIRKGKKPWLFCINRECPEKKKWAEEHNQ